MSSSAPISIAAAAVGVHRPGPFAARLARAASSQPSPLGHGSDGRPAESDPFARVLSRLLEPRGRTAKPSRSSPGAASGTPDRGSTTEAHLDAAARHMAHLGPPASAALPSAVTLPVFQPPTNAPNPLAPAPSVSLSTLEDLMPGLVRRIAWSCNGRRGAVRLEVGAGALAGSTVWVQADGGRVHVTLEAPAGSPANDLEGYRRRIASRLEARGLEIDAFDVT